MEEKITSQKAEQIMDINEEARGVTIKAKMEYILDKKGREGLEKIEKRLEELGFPLKYEEVNPMKFYPVGYESLVLLLSREVFGLSDEEIRGMGFFVSRTNLLIRMFMKYLSSVDLMASSANRMWKKYYTVGEISDIEFDEDKGYAILRIKDYNLPPLHCIFLSGYFISIIQLMVKKNVTCEEKKCVHRGDEYHEFFLEW